MPHMPDANASIEPEVEIDELDWQLRISAATSGDELKDMRAEFDALPDNATKRRIGELIAARRSAISREYAAAIKEAK